jgi:hypothetical protein
MMAAAKPRLSWSTLRAARPFSAIWTVSQFCSVVMTRGQMYWFQAVRNDTSAKLAMTGRLTGMATRRRNPRCPRPSSSAASRRSWGMPRNPWRSRKVPKALARNGAVMPWKLFSQPRSRMVTALTTRVTSMGSISVAM